MNVEEELLQKDCDDRIVNLISKSARGTVLSPQILLFTDVTIFQRRFVWHVIFPSHHVTAFAVQCAFIPALHC